MRRRMESEMTDLKRYMVPGGKGVEQHDAGLLYKKEDVDARILSDADTIAALSAEVSRLRKNAERIDRLHTACGVLSESAEPDIRDNGNGYVVISAFEFVQFEAFLSDYSALKENADG